MDRPTTRFGVLGPIEVYDAGRTQVVSAEIRRTLLAVLLSRSGSVVPRDVLVAAAWRDRPPTPATVRWHIHQLRQLLGDGDQLTSTPDGYLLQVDAEALDASRFELLLARGRDLTDDPQVAATVLAEALALWRGSAYEGLTDVEVLRDEAGRLAEARLAALELRIEADLALGRSAALIPELTALVAESPLHEGFRAQLMLALYRSGRTADALSAYRAGKALIAEELGLDPGERLRKLEHAILIADPALVPADGIRALPPPAELPPDVPALAGRDRELDRIHAALSQGSPIVAIHGQGGVGKSALAIKVSHRLREAFPDGQLYVDLHGATPGSRPLAPLDVLRRFLRSLGLSDAQLPADLDEAAARFRSSTAGRRMLIVLDDAVDAAQVRRLTPGDRGSAVLVTSRMAMATLDGVTQVHLDALAEADALVVLTDLAGRDRIAAEPEATAEVIRLCGGLPLALRIAAARLAARPDWRISELAGRLAGDRRLDELSDADLSVRASISVGRQTLGRDRSGRLADRILYTVPVLDLPDVDAHVVGALVEAGPGEVQAGLDRLVLARLVEALDTGRYGMHDLVRLYASEVAERELSRAESLAAVRRTGHAYLATTRAVAELMRAVTAKPWLASGIAEPAWSPVALEDLGQAIRWIDAERENLVAVAAAVDDPAVIVGLAAVAQHPFASRGWHTEARRVGRIAVDAAQRVAEPSLIATAHHALGAALIATDPAGAIEPLHLARDLFATVDDSLREATVRTTLAHALVMDGRAPEAENELLRAIGLHHSTGEDELEARDLTNLGIVVQHQGRYDEARRRHEDALELRRRLGDTHGMGISLANLGQLALVLDQPQRSVELLRSSVDLLAAWPNRLGFGRLLWDLGTAYRRLGQEGRAASERERSLMLLAEHGLLTSEQADALLAEPDPPMPAPYRRFA
ncbi:BTAD domain-containing putative transcriptional regulator [Kribbella shirazensis]|uniref:BTAD domain-containing putative transcriptional regulator n=1 Tax=Kribbella shirazensis TaxID=1105143 RepID=UPI0014226FED